MMDEQQLLPKDQKKVTRFSTWFAVVFILGFGVALLAMTGVNWGKPCDQPMRVYLLFHGIAGVVTSLFFVAAETMYMESTDPADDGSLKGINLKIFGGIIIYFLITGVCGAAWYFGAEDCEDTAYVTYRWTWAAVLLYLIFASMMFSDVFGKLGGPFFAKLGHLLGSLFQALADFFNTIADILDEGPEDPDNVPPQRSAAAIFAVYVNHAAFLWFFLYIFFEARKERLLDCDKPLRTYLYVFSIVGTILTFIHFLYDMFAGVKTREKLGKKSHIIIAFIVLINIIWGIIGFNWVHSSQTCEQTAVNTYRLAYLLSCCFLVFCCLLGLFLCLGLLDFLCSGKMRFVVVISTGDEEEEEDLQS